MNLQRKLFTKSKGFLSKSLSSHHRSLHHSSIGVIGAPFWKGQSHLGTDEAPDALRGAGLLNKLHLIQPNLVDFGNLHFGLAHAHSGEMMDADIRLQNRNEFMLAQMCAQLSHFVGVAVKKGYTPLVLGGDHSVSVGSVMGTSSALEERSSKTGNLNGMPVSFLLKDIVDAPRRDLFSNLRPCLHSSNVAYIALRNVEPQELAILQQLNIVHYSMRDIDRLGIHEVMSRALEQTNPTGRNRLHVSFDVDSLDDQLMICTGTPVSGGLSVREALSIGEIIHATGLMVALDLVEFNPHLGTKDEVQQAVKYVTDIVLAFFGKSRLGYYHRSVEEQHFSSTT